MEKRCCTCLRILPISEFRIDRKRKDGLSPRCVPCANAAEAASYLGLKLRVVEYLGGRCVVCGYSEDHRALAFDHLDGEGGRARRSGLRGRKFLNAVLAGTAGRLQLLCCNCNAIKRVAEDERGERVYARTIPSSDLPAKWCPKCGETRAASEFYANGARPDGLSSYCRPCANAAMQASTRELRACAISHLGGACRGCGYGDDVRALVFDHVHGGGGKQRQAGVVARAVFNAVLANTGEYQLLCANCNEVKQFEAGERVGKRQYSRTIPTERIERPDIRKSPEWAASFGARVQKLWDDPEFRARQSAQSSARMKARWASGEVPNRRKPAE